MLILVLASVVSAAPVTDLNLTLVDTPELNADLNFSLTWMGGDANFIYVQFDTDGNTIITIDTTTNFLNRQGKLTAGQFIAFDTNMVNQIPVTMQAVYFFATGSSGDQSIRILNDDEVVVNENGYDLRLSKTGDLDLMRRTAGVAVTILSATGLAISNDTNYTAAAVRNAAGVWSLSFNGSSVGGTVHDTNYQSLQWGHYGSSSSGTVEAYNFRVFTVGGNVVRSPTYFQHTFITAGTKTVQATVQNMDGNASTSLTFVVPADVTAPTLENFDVNIMGTMNWGLRFRCTDSQSSTIDYNVFINGTRVATRHDLNGNTYFLSNQSFPSLGSNSFTGECSDASGNTTTAVDGTIAFLSILIPKDIETGDLITPYSVFSADLNLSLSGQTTDINFARFSANSSFTIIISDDNNELNYFPATYIVSASTTTPIQAFLVPDNGDNMEVIVYTIDNPNSRVSLPGITIQSYTFFDGNFTLVESIITDGTGVGTLHFIENQDYNLLFYDGNRFLFQQTVRPVAEELFAYLDTGQVIINPTAPGLVTLVWPEGGFLVNSGDGNATISVLITPIATVVDDINLIVTQDNIIVYNRFFQDVNIGVADYNFTFDLNVSSFEENSVINIQLQMLDVNGLIIGGEHTLVNSQQNFVIITTSILITGIAYLAQAFGSVVGTIFAVIVTLILMAQVTLRRVVEDNNPLLLGSALIMFIFVIFNFISFDAWLFGIMAGGAMFFFKVRE